MEISLRLGSIVFLFVIERELTINDELIQFRVDDEEYDVQVRVSWDWDKTMLPSSECLGEDLLQCYYFENNVHYCLTKAGPKGVIGNVYYNDNDYKTINCFINEKPFLLPYTSMNPIIRLLPMRAIFQHFHVLFFHASQVCYNDVGIMFAAPSGTGKTTQANLWRKYKNAKIICNDRTLVRDKKTYGYPIDGSAPVRSSEVHDLGCIVLLKQDVDNHIERLNIGKAIALLMQQLVIDTWSEYARSCAIEDLMILLKDVPAYILSCTADEKAVDCLCNQLRKDGIIDG